MVDRLRHLILKVRPDDWIVDNTCLSRQMRRGVNEIFRRSPRICDHDIGESKKHKLKS